MTFDPEKQLLHCDYCGNECKVEDVEVEEKKEPEDEVLLDCR